jgi:hypothetical protein
MHYLIDTNVAIAANGKSSAEPPCVIAAIERLQQLMAGEILVLDTAYHILNEYDNHLHHRGQPGVGDLFYQWALRNMHNARHCSPVSLLLDEDNAFAAFPADAALAKFDLSDRKFVAAARTHPANPPVVVATDTDWHEHYAALTHNGVRIELICPEEMARPRRGGA